MLKILFHPTFIFLWKGISGGLRKRISIKNNLFDFYLQACQVTNFQKSSRFKPDCLIIDLNVPIGISFLGEGTITILLPLLNLAWLPLWDTKIKPLSVKVLIICLEESNLDID